MLNTTKMISINGESKIGGTIVANMYATLSTTGVGNENINKTILNQELYNSNKAEVRKDMIDFEDLIYSEQDKLNNNLESEVK
ncbi:hypothetical protein [Paraclostridium bifermentans]